MAQNTTARRGRALAAAAVATAALLLTTACSGAADSTGGAAADGKQLLTIPREDFSTFTRNFNPFSPNAAPMTTQAIYEPMVVFNPAKGNTVPWLATSWDTAKDGRSLTFHLRDGVQWSDGQPLTADDVVYTFQLQKKVLGGFDYLADVRATDAHTVVFRYTKPFSPGLYDIGEHWIIPKHIWEKQTDPAKYTNPDPVGSGPYTQVGNFQSQSYELLRNPHYWQPGKQHIAGIRELAFSGNDSANLATTSGETDWGSQYIPQVQKAFVAKDPAHRHYWFPTTGSMIQWQLNTTKAPFDDPAVRKALSMAIDRDTITKVGMSGYTKPADCTGLSGSYDAYRDSAVVASCGWTTFDTAGANRALDAAGYPKGPDGVRKLKNGKPFSFSISVGSASSDWLSVANIIAQDLRQVGVQATVKSPDWSVVVSSYADGSFDSGIVWSNNAVTPYQYYRGVMSKTTVLPVGKQTTDNYARYSDPKADAALDQLAAATDDTAAKAAVNTLQQIYAADAPVVPLFPGPDWGFYNESRFTGFPNAGNPYATLTDRGPSAVLVLTTVQPVRN